MAFQNEAGAFPKANQLLEAKFLFNLSQSKHISTIYKSTTKYGTISNRLVFHTDIRCCGLGI